MNGKISKISFWSLVVAGIALGISIFLPIWRIDLDAPQYPEGLRLLIYTFKLGGDVEIVNGLNHYIGMKTLHAEEFVEFVILPYITGFFALLSLITALKGDRKWLMTLLTLFVIFGIVAMYDFWRWEYEYGHNLDPNAAIIVPGMAYQPPLIGFKQLLNFGAYSIPDVGGWLFILAGLLMVLATYLEFRKKPINTSLPVSLLIIVNIFSFTSCGPAGPEPIKVNKDLCHHCKMNISDLRFGAELVTAKGRVYKFDDVLCMNTFAANLDPSEIGTTYVSEYTNPGKLILTDSLYFLKSEAISSPMRGNIAAFKDRQMMLSYAEKWKAEEISWELLWELKKK